MQLEAIPGRQVSPLDERPEWEDVEYRQAYLEASIEQGIAWQIRSNRNVRGMTQKELADKLGTQQSAISRLEDPMSPPPSIETLLKVAHALDCALSVRLISYSRLAEESEDLSPEALYAAPYHVEKQSISAYTYGVPEARIESDRLVSHRAEPLC